MPLTTSRATASLTAVSQACTLDVDGLAEAAFQLSGTWVASVLFEATVDDSNWVTVAYLSPLGVIASAAVTANGVYKVPCASYSQVRARCSAYTSGTIVASGLATDEGDGGALTAGNIAGTVTANTELPAARLAADNLALPTAPDVLATLMGYDGTTLDLVRLSAAAESQQAGLFLGTAPLLFDGTGFRVTRTWAGLGDGGAGTTTPPGAPFLFNGSSLDRQRNNIEGTVLASAARTAQTSSADQTNHNARGVICVVETTAASGTGGLTLIIQGKDPVSGSYYSLFAAAAAITAIGTNAYAIYPGIATAAVLGYKGGANLILPRTWRIVVNVGDASSYTYSVSYSYVL